MALNITRKGIRAWHASAWNTLLRNVGLLSPDGEPAIRTYSAGEAVPFTDKLAAWWNGDVIATTGPRASARPGKVVPEIDITRWTPERIRVVRTLWGDNFLEPGGPARARKLFAQVMPNSKQSVLDLTAGLGGTAFTLAKDQGLWMDALEPDPDLVGEAHKSAFVIGLGDQVPVSHLDLTAINIPKHKYHLIYSRERLFVMEDKLALLSAAANGLKSGGFLVITDLITSAPEKLETEGFRAWAQSEPFNPMPWTPSLYAETLEQLGLSVVGRQDVSKDYLEDVHAGWQHVTKVLQRGEFEEDLEHHLLAEGDIWAGRTGALSDGIIALWRFIARRT